MNRLQHASSPYLRQHATNPVDWYEWCPEAFARAREQDKPILLSIGYSACHWCHVMAHESFEDAETAAILNRDFINIKVDREERPDLDDIYMQATQIFTRGHGGWPMTVFLTPEGKPFHAGTYYPKEPVRGMPTFKQVLAAVSDAWRNRRDQVYQVAEQVTEGLQRDLLGLGESASPLDAALLEDAVRAAIRDFDPVYGGLSRSQPKFPTPMNYEFLLSMTPYLGDEGLRQRVLEVVAFSLKKMACGGIYDQVGGGFHRYSVDRLWLVPHFEKMLYDNAQLSRLYLHAWQATGMPFFKRIAEETYDYLLREMQAPTGAFYSSTDADSEGEEGKFFVWSLEELRAALPPEIAESAVAYWDATESGNFEGRNILHVPAEPSQVALRLGIPLETLESHIGQARQLLLNKRLSERVPPHRDEKILTAWNGLAIASFAEAARVLKRPDYAQAAARAADFILESLYQDGRLLRSYLLTPEAAQGDPLGAEHGASLARYNGYLEDYACLIDALIQLYQTTFEPRWLEEAVTLAETVLIHFPAEDGGFYDTSDDHEQLITRPRNLQDNAVPSGNSVFAKVLLQLAAYTGETHYSASAEAILKPLVNAMREYPLAFGEMLCAARLLVHGVQEVAIIGATEAPQTIALLEVVQRGYYPNAVVAHAPDEAEVFPPLLVERTPLDGQPTAYVCRQFVCQLPVNTPEALRAQLSA
ncbi:MAG: thioredoxin domain-containing protein [Chloroflexota bacterium]|nr:MAG: thioredoxin domain-containing protein [Chloroflexota bacterium]